MKFGFFVHNDQPMAWHFCSSNTTFMNVFSPLIYLNALLQRESEPAQPTI